MRRRAKNTRLAGKLPLRKPKGLSTGSGSGPQGGGRGGAVPDGAMAARRDRPGMLAG